MTRKRVPRVPTRRGCEEIKCSPKLGVFWPPDRGFSVENRGFGGAGLIFSELERGNKAVTFPSRRDD